MNLRFYSHHSPSPYPPLLPSDKTSFVSSFPVEDHWGAAKLMIGARQRRLCHGLSSCSSLPAPWPAKISHLALHAHNTLTCNHTSLSPPQNEEKHSEEILDRVEEWWLGEEWTRTMPHLISDLLQQNFTSTRNSTSTRVSHATEGIQWIRMEELGKAPTNRCRAVRELSNQKTEKSHRDQR